jgi:hypothetical protein
MTAIVGIVSITMLNMNGKKGKVGVEIRQDSFGNIFRAEAEFGRDSESLDPSQHRLEPTIAYGPPTPLPPLVEPVPIQSLPEAAAPERIEKKPAATSGKASKPKRRTGR